MQNNLINNQSHLFLVNNFSSFFNKWLIFCDIKATSLKTYNATIKHFIEFLQKEEITHPTREDIIKYRDSLINTNYKATTIKNKIQILKAFFKWLEYENLYKNIALNIKTPKISQEYKHDYLKKDQIKNLLNSIDKTTKKGLRDYAIIILMLTTGLRINEISKANKQDIKTKNNMKVLYILGKGHETKEDYVILTDIVFKAITEYLKTRTDNNESLFISNQVKQITTRQIENIINYYFEKIGIKTEFLTAHSLRTTTATQNILNGGTLQQTQQLLRHKNIQTTTMYAHILEKEQNQNEQRISNFIETLTTENEK